mgnify:CR=1 FL=1|tara:strand:- start:728 stop:1489 length:762 start_codon:yes stop_codon:yes gene_type:complete
MLSPTIFIKDLCNLPDVTLETAEEDCNCGVCGVHIKKGDPADPMELPDTFTNNRDLADFSAPYRCHGCAAVMTDQRFQQKYSAHIFCEDGMFPANKKIHRGYWLMNPPKPPYLFILGVTKSQHVAWRAPINVSEDIILIRHGDDVLKIRKKQLHQAVNVTHELRVTAEKMAIERGDPKKKIKDTQTLKPFTYSDLKGQRVNQSEPQRWLMELIKESEDAAKLAEPLFTLTPHECWALDFCLTTGLEKPESEKF